MRTSTRSVAAIVVFASAARTTQACCPYKCNGNGECKMPECVCSCKKGFFGGDCLQRYCPKGISWSDDAAGTDNAHNLAECSNMGVCDRVSGDCECIIGFSGKACERKSCPNHCNGHGTCHSALEYAELRDPGAKASTFHSEGYRVYDATLKDYVYQADTTEMYSYKDVWDSKMLHKCVCDPGYVGNECAQRACPKGDDPYTGTADDPSGLQYNEVQTFKCFGSEGSFAFKFRGLDNPLVEEISPDILVNDNAAAVKTKLESMSTIRHVTVVFEDTTAGATVCSLAPKEVRVTFTQDFGDLPILRVDTTKLTLAGRNGQLQCPDSNVVGVAAVAESVCPPCSNANRASNYYICKGANWLPWVIVTETTKGTKEHLECSRRGICDPQTGICTCNAGFDISDGTGGRPAVDADPNRANCGWNNPDETLGGIIFDCPGEVGCSGHGLCAGSPTYACQCSVGWTGADCSERTCPFGKAWVTLPTADGVSHQQEECAGVGVCDRSKGFCQCGGGFEGSACDRIICPGTPVCSGHGQCLSQQHRAVHTSQEGDSRDYTYGERNPNNRHVWDSGMTHGCKCDPGFYGIDCALRYCPHGDDPRVRLGTFEKQSIVCTATTGFFSLGFRQHQTATLSYQASREQVEAALNALPSIGEVSVRFSVVDHTKKLLDVCKAACESGGDVDFNATGCGTPTCEAPGDGLVQTHPVSIDGSDVRSTCLCAWDGENASTVDRHNASLTFLGLDYEDLNTALDGKVDFTYDSLLPCTTFDSTHTASTQTPCVRLDAACNPRGTNQILVEFLTELGDLPAIYPTLDGVISVLVNTDGQALSVKGTKSNYECSNRGACNVESGRCFCYPGYSSSDGNGKPGTRGDCGYVNKHQGHLNKLYIN